nr:immunoglobulin heavy chain junction region [Mus musculus]MBK4198032.1 immunoglobulin heavy chain junction region [Mus musculus]MBK4198033.1 immunoglobulin heavy chain junction region [Mus musculus]MBK4198034.1 immunoglobulin heavy chain junction region [Mus musculus]MBK4198035.1 immunoglobulin heavy chain junction region [Mus musculus]
CAREDDYDGGDFDYW